MSSKIDFIASIANAAWNSFPSTRHPEINKPVLKIFLSLFAVVALMLAQGSRALGSDTHFEMDVQFPSKGEKISSSWLEEIFPSVTKCTPDSFYYDKNAQRSNNGVLEKLGYSPYKIDDYVARYRINENFHGLSATEIAIPSGTDSVYSVTVSNGVRVLSDAIHKKTGKRLQIYNQRFKATSGVAYLISEDKQKTSFVCFTFQG